MTELNLLGTPLLATTYEELGAKCLEWASGPSCVSMEFANTQIVTMRRHEPDFLEKTSKYDYFIPDGMPLIWCLNRAGAGLKDRVYGPTFMREFLSKVPKQYTHYLLGGSEECGSRIKEIFQKLNPGIQFVGAFHGRCGLDGILDGNSEQMVMADLARLSPDFIWVGFGTPKQQAWTRKHKQLIRRGVILTVGFAFDVNAGMKPDAPIWMQRLGLTWVFRLLSEPKRLASRYAKYNFLFGWYLFWDAIRGKVIKRAGGV
ncbi:WecB/TagA/CpsF family glycosyltransferase [Pedosphaera parvula]|uniref:Glycosyl transferase, WecB/TagA/CpsF family n=1 Tax=Pedosphaera parvula (strain Ellin514) TaxID=320771 RepID=B9XSD2_PEDPL|nr:WecB/TagA/CpsF family glycosyltransferase [Pedosphaera parvula]EEF57265.1 glycosyl transferase, WecB/TagA/CpsF family [Pedosphaera parvula Ellin514]